MHAHSHSKRHIRGIQTVLLTRGRSGYGFTISGQKPCRLGGIVQGSAADHAGLQVGDRVMGIDGHDVSNSTHDDVVRRIGLSRGMLTLEVADRSSDSSSDDDSSECEVDFGSRSTKNGLSEKVRRSPIGECNIADSSISSWQKMNGNGKYAKFQGRSSIIEHIFGPSQNSENHCLQSLHSTYRNSRSDVCKSDHHQSDSKHADSGVPRRHVKHTIITREARLGLDNIRCTEELCHQRSSPDGSTCSCHEESVLSCDDFQVVVSYSGSVEMPNEAPRLPGSRLQSIRAAVQRLRATRNSRSLVLMNIDADGIRLVDCSHYIVAHYVTDRIAFCGICPDDRRFFGIVMTPAEKENDQFASSGSSCHVFMVDPELSDHRVHASTAARFGVNCTMDLDTDCCLEFPKSASPIIRYLGQLYRQRKNGGGFFAPISTVLNETKSSNQCGGIIENGRACVVDMVNPKTVGGSLEQSFIHDLSVIHPTPCDYSEKEDEWARYEMDGCITERRCQNIAANVGPSTSERLNARALSNTRDIASGMTHRSAIIDDVNSADNLRRSARRILSAERQQWPSKQLSNDNMKSTATHNSSVKNGSALRTRMQPPPPVPPRQTLLRSDSDRASGRISNIKTQISQSGTKLGSSAVIKIDDSSSTEVLVSSASKPPLPERRPVVSRSVHKSLAPVPRRDLLNRPKSTPPVDLSSELPVARTVDSADYDSDPGEQLHEGQTAAVPQVMSDIFVL
jgi:PDZ domain/Phosphotyrosine interaction domain (PTB/PID)